MDALEELAASLTGTARAILISEKEVDLRPQSGDNRVFILKIGEGSLAAGGRGGGFGERRVTGVQCFALREGRWTKLFESEEGASDFEVPYQVSRLPMTMADGTESVGYGVVEPELVGEMARMAGMASSV